MPVKFKIPANYIYNFYYDQKSKSTHNCKDQLWVQYSMTKMLVA